MHSEHRTFHVYVHINVESIGDYMHQSGVYLLGSVREGGVADWRVCIHVRIAGLTLTRRVHLET